MHFFIHRNSIWVLLSNGIKGRTWCSPIIIHLFKKCLHPRKSLSLILNILKINRKNFKVLNFEETLSFTYNTVFSKAEIISNETGKYFI